MHENMMKSHIICLWHDLLIRV